MIAEPPAPPVDSKLLSVRPSLLDRRFTGDPWIESNEAGEAALCLANYAVSMITLLPFDLPSFNRTFNQMRIWLKRHREPN